VNPFFFLILISPRKNISPKTLRSQSSRSTAKSQTQEKRKHPEKKTIPKSQSPQWEILKSQPGSGFLSLSFPSLLFCVSFLQSLAASEMEADVFYTTSLARKDLKFSSSFLINYSTTWLQPRYSLNTYQATKHLNFKF